MQRPKPLKRTGRLLVALIAIVVLAGGITYAALQSQPATLQGSTITSATASLLIGDDQNGFGSIMPGFMFANIEPGAGPNPSNDQYITFKNTGSTQLQLRAMAPTIAFNNPSQVDTHKVLFTFTPLTGGGQSRQLSLAALLDASTSNTPISLDSIIAAGQTLQVRLQVTLLNDIVASSGQGFTLSGIDITFSGMSAP